MALMESNGNQRRLNGLASSDAFGRNSANAHGMGKGSAPAFGIKIHQQALDNCQSEAKIPGNSRESFLEVSKRATFPDL